MAQAEPATAGFYLDSSGALVVWVKDSTKFDDARAEASGLLGSLAPTSSLRRAVRSIRLRKADFSFQQVSDWRDSVFVHLLGAVPGVNMDDFDEATNRVVIGLTKDELARRFSTRWSSTAYHSSPSASKRLRRRIPDATAVSNGITADTLAGGYNTYFYDYAGHPFLCSAGVVVSYAGVMA